MNQAIESKNKALVLEALDTLFNKRDYAAAEKYWSPHYIQHSAHIEPGRDGLFNLIKSMPPTFKHEHEQIVAEGEFVIVAQSLFWLRAGEELDRCGLRSPGRWTPGRALGRG